MYTLTPEQRDAIVRELERSQNALLGAARGLTPAQLTWKSSPERWSIAENLEHVALAEVLFQGRLDRMSEAEPSAETVQRVAGKEEATISAGRDRHTKRMARGPALPNGNITSFEAFEAHFTPLRQQSIAFVQSTNAPLHAVTEVHHALGELSGHQWLCLLSAHCERHAAQAQEVRATPGFPFRDVTS